MSETWLDAEVIDNRHWTDVLFSLKVRGPALKFEAGQFVRIALDIEGQRVARPFSFVNSPQDPVLEFYGVVVPEGPLSPRLERLVAGDRLYVAPNPAGFLVLSEVPASAQSLWLMATGTGIAPFLSMLQTDALWARFREVILVHAVRHAKELVYQELIREIRGARPALRTVTFVSREPHPASLAGRMPAAIADGRLERAARASFSDASHVMLCGNPAMLKDARAALIARGLRKHRRHTPGHIAVESFW
jgi:ferredoxin--NADP+ reductase